MKQKSTYLALTAFAMFIAVQSQGQSVTLSLNNVPEAVQCNEVWTEQDLDLSFVSTTVDDCASDACYFAASGPAIGFAESVMVWPSRLTVDLSSLEGIQAVEVDIVDYCGFYCTQAFLMDSTGIVSIKGNSESSVSETLVMDNLSQTSFTELAISGCESGINEIRIYQNTSSIENSSSVDRKVLRIVDALGREVHFTRGQLLFHLYDDGSVEKKFVGE
ncbi:MAG: hypothetical protein OSA37_07225 [Flavobacteriales bacterium]|nr:hypothetical protein [Flavobacteriales bacterium]